MPNVEDLRFLEDRPALLDDLLSVLLMAEDCATIASLIENVKNGVASLMVMPYYALFCRASEEYFDFQFDDTELEKEMYDIRNAIKVYSERFAKSQKRFHAADTSQDLLYMKLGKLQEIDIRTVWKHEQYDFSKWLATEENIQELGDTLKARRDSTVIHTLSKLPSYIRYVENEYGIIVLKKTQRRKLVPCRRDRYAA